VLFVTVGCGVCRYATIAGRDAYATDLCGTVSRDGMARVFTMRSFLSREFCTFELTVISEVKPGQLEVWNYQGEERCCSLNITGNPRLTGAQGGG